LLRCAFSLVHSAAYGSGGFDVKLAQVGERFGVARVELDGGFKLLAGLFGQGECAEEGGTAGSLAGGPAQPQMVAGILRVEIDCLLALRGRLIELLQGVLDAAEEVIGFCAFGIGFQGFVEKSDGLIGFAGLQVGVGCGQRCVGES